MYIYTFNPTSQKHLKMPVPIEWNNDDVDFFLKGKEHLSKLEQRAEDRPIAMPKPEITTEDVPEPVNESEPAEVPVAVPLPVVAAGGCQKHPTYTGKRLGKNVKDCPTCRALYNKLHSEG